ncbi:cell wall elongation regulator TseB-like domain-containing protein [Metabacillus malikii]|uniref:Uncharacterized protein YpmB n=1 Tax=Metabacillus malikii TaxID=1504265 RepID=A0ABT9ZAB2_9BACI|nr:DUF5590 domain-containing protein [Metabacillus malikii]MDQ0228787.1 uncharacterized protein YpmB [Metabacillus malikii]
MKKNIIITFISIIILIIIAIVVFFTIFQSAREQYTSEQQQSIDLALENKGVTSIDKVDTFHGKIKYHVLSGINAEEQNIYIWIPKAKNKDDNKDKKMIVKKQSEGITKEEAISIVSKEYNMEKLINAKLGMDEGIPIWEVKYRDKSERYTIDYVDFKSGAIIKHMALKKEMNP